jgi:SPP1 family predicted phage head-tail adaptor
LKVCAKDFTEQVAIEALTLTSDGAGGQAQSWTLRGNVWAIIEQKSGSDPEVSGRIATREGYQITIRYWADVATKDRVEVDGKYFRVVRIDDIERKKKFMKLYVESDD